MDTTPDGTAEDLRVAEIRLDIELARKRIVDTVDALEYKADVPARIADVLSVTASSITTSILQRIPSRASSREQEAADTDETAAVRTSPPR